MHPGDIFNLLLLPVIIFIYYLVYLHDEKARKDRNK